MTNDNFSPGNLGSIIKNDNARGLVYAVWFVAGILIGAAQVAFPDPDPQWLEITFKVWSYLGLYVSALAIANRKSSPQVVYAPEARPSTINTDTVVLEGKDSTAID